VLEPGESLLRTYDLRDVLGEVLDKERVFKIRLSYRYSGAKRINSVRAVDGVIRAKEIMIEVRSGGCEREPEGK